MSDEILGDRGKALEELFFARESKIYRQAKQEKKAMESRRADLSVLSS